VAGVKEHKKQWHVEKIPGKYYWFAPITLITNSFLLQKRWQQSHFCVTLPIFETEDPVLEVALL